MRNKEVVLRKITKLESNIKKVGYNIKVNNLDEAFKQVGVILESIVDIESLINHEVQE